MARLRRSRSEKRRTNGGSKTGLEKGTGAKAAEHIRRTHQPTDTPKQTDVHVYRQNGTGVQNAHGIKCVCPNT